MFKRIIKFVIVVILIILVINTHNEVVLGLVVSPSLREEPSKIGVLLSNYDDVFISLIQKNLEQIQIENSDKIEHIFFDGKGNQSIQNDELNTLLERKDVDLIILNLVEQGATKYTVDRIKENNIPVIIFGGADSVPIKSYNKAYWIGTDPIQDGILQGKLIIDIWNKDKNNIDKNRDNIIQYIMLQGRLDNMYAINRSKYSISTTNNAGIKTEELESRECNWNEKEAYNAMKSLLLRFGKNIEMIIANNDPMAIGAIKALQEFGYNTDNNSILIHVVGYDATDEARELIKKGFMAGTVIQDPTDWANAIFQVETNVINNRPPLEGTEYTYDFISAMIVIPLGGIITK